MFGILRSIRFLFMAPVILAFLTVVNLMTSPGVWWVQWAALGLGIAWFVKLLRVIQAVVIAGGLAALGYYLWNRYGNPAQRPAWANPPQGWAPPPEGWASQPVQRPAPAGLRLPE